MLHQHNTFCWNEMMWERDAIEDRTFKICLFWDNVKMVGIYVHVDKGDYML